jgi:CheY-like chemotaxis protein
MKTLIVLEDEPSVMKLLHLMLKQYCLVEATSAEQALRLFNDHARQIDLLLADLTLPISSGIQVALTIRSEVPNLPVILTSGYPVSGWNERDAADLETLGGKAVAVLQKPFHKQILLNTVSGFLGLALPEKVRTAGPPDVY